MASKEYRDTESWLHDMGVLFEALTTGGQRIYITADYSQFSGIHVPPGETAEFERTFKFRIVGREPDGN